MNERKIVIFKDWTQMESGVPLRFMGQRNVILENGTITF